MKENTWIEGWFEKYEEREIKPWEWDFKQSYIKEPISENTSPIRLMLEYKMWDLKEIGICNSTGKTGKEADCDKEPYSIYDVLWNRDKVIRGETMNSFITTFNHSTLKSSDSVEEFEKIGILIERSLTKQYAKLISNDFTKFNLIDERIDEFKKFATATHCIGNFTVLPHWMNSGRYLFSQDYWDVTMYSLFEFFQPLGCWKQFVERYFLQPYVNNDEEWTVSEFWKGHFDSIGNYNQLKPQNEQELSEYLHKVNLKIEKRGKWIIKKVCEELKLQHFTFYDELKDRQIRFSNEMN
ncbi:hypothetical protein P5485_003330 [Bacillus pumilus]|uniref:hypothetical protein n=1 Tax=Bacillus pumilus TaxID=1408 RepID=UPI00078B482C|nr:hypothetical protein [Bacillus pumilus]AMM96418.1 hypothetical protein UP12_03275 [Bacillus pumilus]MDH3150437.1 hypothetical protein [Bacillus pumilus]